MKICILLSSYEGTGSVFQEIDEYQNPDRYVKSHDFEKRLITKENANKQIDEIVEEGFDYIWNFLWGTYDDNVAGVSAIKYLESKNVPILGASSKYVSMNKLDFKKAFRSAKVKTPEGIALTDEDPIENFELNGLNFPLIVKPANGCGSELLTTKSVCHNLSELVEQVKKLKFTTKSPILIEEFIVGEEISVMVLETKDGVIALAPIVYGFPEQWKETEKFFDFDKKFHGIDRGEITYKLFDGNPYTLEKIKEDSIRAYLALGVSGSGYGRIDIRLKDGNPYFLEVNNTPAFFSRIGNTFGDDYVIEQTFPGGHTTLVDTIISSRIRFDSINREYNIFSSTYQDLWSSLGASINSIWSSLSEKFEFDGTVLDLGCGTGNLGKIIKQRNESTLIGIDLCPEMTKFATDYKKLHIGLIENVILELDVNYDHIISSGALTYCCKRNFEKIFYTMFNLATSSITITVEDIPDEYISNCEEIYKLTCFNHIKTVENLSIPSDWNLVYRNRDFFWKSPNIGTLVFGIVLRYEKVKKLPNYSIIKKLKQKLCYCNDL